MSLNKESGVLTYDVIDGPQGQTVELRSVLESGEYIIPFEATNLNLQVTTDKAGKVIGGFFV